jgi:hypothetical protein
MQILKALKTFGLGTVFLLTVFGLYIMFAVVYGIWHMQVEPGPVHATGLSAIIAGLIEGTIFNVWFWLLCAVAYGLAFWIVKRHA